MTSKRKLKLPVLLFILLFAAGNVYSQSTAPGYYITQKGDTVATQIKLRKGVFGQVTNDFVKEVVVVDSAGNSKEFTPADIKGYGLLHDSKQYRFASKPVKDGSYKFLAPIFVGLKTSVYQYGLYTSGSGTNMSSNQVFYTFEKADGTFLFLRNILNEKFRSELKEFYKGNVEVQLLIDEKLRYFLSMQQDLKEIMRVANR